MMKNLVLILALFIGMTACKKSESKKELSIMETTEVVSSENLQAENIYQFTVKDLSGEEFKFSDLKGKKIMIVNTASKCGNTPQYEDLQKVYEKYKAANFVIVGFPANNFGAQEPGSDSEIAEFCKLNYGVTFPMMSKISVKGDDMNEVYKFLTKKEKNGFADSEVSWNFQKYLIDENGELAQVVSPRTLPTDKDVIAWIEAK